MLQTLDGRYLIVRVLHLIELVHAHLGDGSFNCVFEVIPCLSG
jgi:hypothetical protein